MTCATLQLGTQAVMARATRTRGVLPPSCSGTGSLPPSGPCRCNQTSETANVMPDIHVTPEVLKAGGALAAILAFFAAVFRTVPKLLEVQVGSDQALRHDLAARVAHLEKRDERCDKLLRELRGQVVVIAHSTMELSTVVERHEPNAPALHRAKLALRRAFPIDLDPDQAGLATLAREIQDKRP